MNDDLIYLDYAATTPLLPQAAEAMNQCLLKDKGLFGNPSSSHLYGQRANDLIDKSAEALAQLINAEAKEITWTSGATESNNLAILGTARANRFKGTHIITVKTEHKAVLDPYLQLEREGFKVTFLDVDTNGQIDLKALSSALDPDTILISCMWVNNESGVIQPIEQIGQLAQTQNILFHVDAVQAIGKLPVNVKAAHIDLLSLSAHKFYGPKGIGALYIRRRPKVRIEPILYGGGQQKNLRSGTLPVHQIAGLGACARFFLENSQAVRAHLDSLKDCFLTELEKQLTNRYKLHLSPTLTAPHIVNLELLGDELEKVKATFLRKVMVSAGSACTSAALEPSHVLSAMRISSQSAHNSLRFSWGLQTTHIEIQKACQLLKAAFEQEL